MLSSSRFLVAIHVLSMLAHRSDSGPLCSNVIAKSVDTNPVVIRRLMSQLEKASLVTSIAGRAGGFLLNRKACDMTLADIYSAVEDDAVFRMHKIGPDALCPFAAQLSKILEPKLKSAERALTASLSDTRLSDVALAIS
jgi:Rrf2 family protein